MDQLTLSPPIEEPLAIQSELRFDVAGIPIPQGSLRGFARGGRVHITADNPKTRPWKAAVTADASAAVHAAGMAHPAYGREPVGVMITFRLPRPKGHYGRHGLLPSAPRIPITTPDLDKLTRAVLDALTGIVYRDDAQVATLGVEKVYADDDRLRTTIEVGPAR